MRIMCVGQSSVQQRIYQDKMQKKTPRTLLSSGFLRLKLVDLFFVFVFGLCVFTPFDDSRLILPLNVSQ